MNKKLNKHSINFDNADFLSSRYISYWLITLIIMVGLMISIGGITRLTESGLSMVEWRPLWGFLPPLNDAEWNRIFNLYMTSPEYILKNNGMDLSSFKNIFFWEYFHRLWGRLIGIIFIIPVSYTHLTLPTTPYV